MSKRIRYSLGLMTICILGIILTQGFWLYKDYRYYRGQPLFSTDYNFFYRTSEYAATLAKDKIQVIPALPVLIAYPADGKSSSGQLMPTSPLIHAKRMNTESRAPLLITNLPSSPVYKTMPFEAPLSHVLKKMKWQFGGSIMLILFTSSCFIYIIVTILMQNKLSVAKNDFIHIMTHELKTPLSTVSVAIEAMNNFGALENRDKTKRYLDVSKKELEHLSKMIEMIMQLSIYESYEMVLNKSIIHIETLIENVVAKYGLSAQVQITVHHHNQFIKLLADKTHLSNVIQNLIDNSIKYTTAPVIIDIETRIDQNNCVISVKDNGPGIPKKYQKSVFEKFFRIPKPEKPAVKGFGLGLSYVKQVIELHQGNINLSSEEKLGCLFTIHIPLNLFE